MTLNDLPQEIREKLVAERTTLCEKWYRNTAWEVCFVNEDGTRYFHAYRKNDFGITYGCINGWWEVFYGAIKWRHMHRVFWGIVEEDYLWVESNRYKKSKNGTEIPFEVHTKKDVLKLAKAIGIFNI